MADSVMCADRRRAGVAGNLLDVRSVHRIALLVVAAGCVTREPSELSPYVEPPPFVPDVVVSPGGPHRVTTHFELDVEELVAQPATLTRTLSAFAAAPGATMLTVAADSAPLVVLRADLPDALEQRLAGWIDEAVHPLSRLSVLSIEWSVDASFDTFDVESELAFDAGTMTHRLIAVDFTPGGLEQRFELVGAAGDVLEATAPITTAGYGLRIGEHELVVGIGEFAWDAVSANLVEMGGVRGTLGAAMQCSIVALSVATRCDAGTCVGHLGELTQLCEQALDEIVIRGRAEAAAFRFVTLGLEGTAGMDDRNKDGVGEGLFGGTWTLELDAGAGAITTTASFD